VNVGQPILSVMGIVMTAITMQDVIGTTEIAVEQRIVTSIVMNVIVGTATLFP
jgi:hypothetical protein